MLNSPTSALSHIVQVIYNAMLFRTVTLLRQAQIAEPLRLSTS